MIIRTVLDLRPKLPKYRLQTVLLAATWHRHASEFAPLEILTIGVLPSPLHEFFSSIGAALIKTAPNHNDRFSSTSNSIQGAASACKEQVLLLDNDVVFTGSIQPLATLPIDKLYGAISGGFRVSPEQWHAIDTELNLLALPADEIPYKEQLRSLIDPCYKVRKLDVAYINGGVILFPPGHDFKTMWETQQATMAAFFEEHPLRNNNVYKSNMAALATMIGSYGKFAWLPAAYNYMAPCFALGLCQTEEIRLVHMTGLRRRKQCRSLSRWIDEYWDIKIIAAISQLNLVLDKQSIEERAEIADSVRAGISSTVKDYDLDNLCNFQQ